MIEELPNFFRFTAGYWNQMGVPVYGTIENAMAEKLKDSERLSDGGSSFRNDLRREIDVICSSARYRKWLAAAERDFDTINSVGGRLVHPEEAAKLIPLLAQ